MTLPDRVLRTPTKLLECSSYVYDSLVRIHYERLIIQYCVYSMERRMQYTNYNLPAAGTSWKTAERLLDIVDNSAY